MAIGRTMKKAHKAIRSMEIGTYGFEERLGQRSLEEWEKLLKSQRLSVFAYSRRPPGRLIG